MIKAYHWWTEWCSPCKIAEPIWAKFKSLHPEIEFHDINADVDDILTRKYTVMSIPNFIVEKEDGTTKQHIGVPKLEDLEALLV
jgi:thiol-disulfide isomerase/thioredoxin